MTSYSNGGTTMGGSGIGGVGTNGSSSGTRSKADHSEFWKDDFTPLQHAGKKILSILRDDESSAHGDLYRRIMSSTPAAAAAAAATSTTTAMGGSGGAGGGGGSPDQDGVPNHHYFQDNDPNVGFRHKHSIPLPPYLQEQLPKAKVSTTMGLFPQAELAWMTIDDCIYLWAYTRSTGSVPSQSQFLHFKTPTNQPIISVGLAPPKEGVFRGIVEWCLVVTTKEEAMLCALARDKQQNGGLLSLIPTKFVIPSDWISFLSVAATKTGRIFLGGQDGNLYELEYDLLVQAHYITSDAKNASMSPGMARQLENFYDGASGTCPSTLVEPNVYSSVASTAGQLLKNGKTVLDSWVFLPTSRGRQADRKCRKLNHSQSSLAANLLPDFINQVASAIFGDFTTTGGGPITQMVVDDERQVLYTLSTRGWVCALDLQGGPSNNKVTLAAVLDAPSTARLYLEAVSRGRMYPPAVSNTRDGLLSFPGGGEAAQAGVGGMEGARSILKLAGAAKKSRQHRRSPTSSSVLTPIAIEVVPNQESTRITLVAITSGGLRYYLTTLSPNTLGIGPSTPAFGTPRHRHPLKPFSRFTLCHIRSPPRLDIMGSFANAPSPRATNSFSSSPSLSSCDSHSPSVPKSSLVDASCYRLGTFLIAYHNTNGGQNNGQNPGAAGNVLVAVGADNVARQTIRGNDENTATTTYIAPGGVCELLSYPLQRDDKAMDSTVRLVPGGRVWDIGASSPLADKVLSLTVRSKTPSDSDLGVGLVPAYVPPAKRRMASSSSKNSSNGKKYTGLATTPLLTSGAVLDPTKNQKTLTSLAVSYFSNIVSKPLSYVLNVGKTAELKETRPALYRISKRSASETGFSLSAADRKNSGRSSSSSSARSPRLSPWLLTPDVVPLNPLALEHLESRALSSFVALNSGGVHTFAAPALLQQLAAALFASGTNERTDPGVSKYFNSYGYAEGCAMCVVLALQPSSSDELKARALRAAMGRAYRPGLETTNEGSQQPQSQMLAVDSQHHDLGSAQQNDAWVPSGYCFTSSALCQGLSLVLARLLRPIWFKPAVVVTEGRVLKRGSKSTSSPAKVELLLDDDTLEQIRYPLHAMQQLVSQVFSKAVASVPVFGTNSKTTSDDMDIDDEAHYLTRSLEYQHRGMQASATNFGFNLRASDIEELAQHIEERDIHCIYRLLTRAVQLLDLLSHLAQAHAMADWPEVEWGLLHGVTIAQLVLSREGQERVESLLNSLITSSDSRGGGRGGGQLQAINSADANQLSHVFANQCYYFFSPGSRFTYLGFQSAQEALSLPPGQSRRDIRAREAIGYLKSAARHWHSPSLITGRLLQTRESEDFDEVSRRALQYNSPLAKACSFMIDLSEVVALVEICLLTASNFSDKKHALPDSSAMETHSPGDNGNYSWEKGLYHKRRDVGSRGSMDMVSPTSPSASNALALGTTITENDAVATCYALIFHHMTRLLNSPTSSAEYELGERMVSVCAYSSNKSFLKLFYQHLFKQNHKDVLLRIESPDLEKWLTADQKDDPDLVLSYYQIQGRFKKAAEHAGNRANDNRLKLSLHDRIECLNQASDSYGMAIQNSQQSGEQEEMKRNKKQVDDRLKMARLQGSVLHAMTQLVASDAYDVAPDFMDRLQYTLLSVSDLVNKYALPYGMYENCLMILHSCHHDDGDYIQKLWKSILCEEIFPCSTRSEGVFRSLRFFAEGSLLESPNIKLLDNHESSTTMSENDGGGGPIPLFESGTWWMKRIEGRVIGLGQELFGKGADFIFPVNFIILCLEELRNIYINAIRSDGGGGRDGLIAIANESQRWAFTILVSVGVPYLETLNAYSQIIEQENHATMGGINPQRRLEHVQNLIAMLERFVAAASSASSGSSSSAATAAVSGVVVSPGFQQNQVESTVYAELTSAVASGALMEEIDSCKTKLRSLPGDISFEENRLQVLERTVKQFYY